MSGFDYKKAGVDVEAGDALVDWLADSEKNHKNPFAQNIVEGIGGFASLFRMPTGYENPCLVTCTDGVGTKVKLAAHYNRMSGIGQDLVAMCVNDLICTGGDPLMFLDYYAVSKLDLAQAKEFLQGVRKACADSNCALVGGETAEMPGVYHGNDFDCAGFAVGVVDEKKRWGAHRVQKSDRLIGIASSGFHSNGYSLLRKVFEKDMDQWIDVLMTPTALYVDVIQDLKKEVDIHATAHITGGGIENIPRVLPEHVNWKMQTWDWPEPFREVQKRTQMSDDQMLKTLNCGLGLVVIVSPESVEKTKQVIASKGFRCFDVGGLE